MKMHRPLQIIFITSFFFSIYANNLKEEFDQSVWIDAEEVYRLHWSVDYQQKSISFGIEVKTNGWVAFGISKGLSGKIKYADLMIGWVDSTGRGFLKDCHGTKAGWSKYDKYQDLTLLDAYQNEEITFLKFTRKLSTCRKDDRSIQEGTLKILFGWGSSDPESSFDACSIISREKSKIKSRSLNLLNSGVIKQLPDGTKHVDLVHKNVSVPEKRTTYWCTVFTMDKLVNLREPKHIIEFQPLVPRKSRSIVHHMVLYECDKSFDEKDRTYSGDCHSAEAPISVQSCSGTSGIFAWGKSGSSFQFPENVGYPIGTKDSSKYFVLETHFNNALQRNGLVDTSGIRIYYGLPRLYEAAMLTVGLSMSENLIIPPGMKKWTLKGVCMKQCTQKMNQHDSLSTNSIKIFATFPHAHETGIGIRTTVARDGKEIAEIVRNDNFDPNYQQMFTLQKPVEVKAGDEIFTYCTYRTLKRKYATIGGVGSDKEMCMNFMMYYPKTNLTYCSNNEMVVQPAFTASYANPVFPKCLKRSNAMFNWQFSNWTGVKWTKPMVDELYNFYNHNDPLPMVWPHCYGLHAYHYNLPGAYRPVVQEHMPRRKQDCP